MIECQRFWRFLLCIGVDIALANVAVIPPLSKNLLITDTLGSGCLLAGITAHGQFLLAFRVLSSPLVEALTSSLCSFWVITPLNFSIFPLSSFLFFAVCPSTHTFFAPTSTSIFAALINGELTEKFFGRWVTLRADFKQACLFSRLWHRRVKLTGFALYCRSFSTFGVVFIGVMALAVISSAVFSLLPFAVIGVLCFTFLFWGMIQFAHDKGHSLSSRPGVFAVPPGQTLLPQHYSIKPPVTLLQEVF